MALALEGRFEPFSQGRGFITPARVEEMETIAARHGIDLAPLYNADGPVENGLHRETEKAGLSSSANLATLQNPHSVVRLQA
jgi:hypothetical protein